MTRKEANALLLPCSQCGSMARIIGSLFYGVECIDDSGKNSIYGSKGYRLSHGTHGTAVIYNTLEETVAAWNKRAADAN